jgi:DNA-binding MarR family transcriptional regulator
VGGRPGSAKGDGLLWSDLALGLGKAERAVTRRLARVLGECNCTVERWRALTFLADGSSHTMSALTDFAALPPPGVTRLVDGMVADNLVYRKADSTDRRRVLVHITARGRDLHRKLVARLAVPFGNI